MSSAPTWSSQLFGASKCTSRRTVQSVSFRQDVKRTLIAAGMVVALAYAADDISVRYKIPAARQVTGAVLVRKIYAVRRKNGSTEFLFGDPANVSCVNSLVPHLGLSPCWYLERHTEQREDICDGCDPTGLTK
jgi:hypothetical protein